MAALPTVYKQLTGVDIDREKRIWDERGKGYYGEYLVFCKLYQYIPGHCKILMNLHVPVDKTHTTEIDLLLIHETGLYVFEIKHYKGTIYGKDTDSKWTQYFRTSQNSVFQNPVEQNGYHIRALQQLYPDLPIYSIIVFTQNDCEIKVQNTNSAIDICALPGIQRVLSSRFEKAKPILSINDIDEIFRKVSVYSPMQKSVTVEDTEASFFTWIQPIIDNLEKQKANMATEVQNQVSKIIDELQEQTETLEKQKQSLAYEKQALWHQKEKDALINTPSHHSEAPLSSWIQPIIDNLEKQKQSLAYQEHALKKQKKKVSSGISLPP